MDMFIIVSAIVIGLLILATFGASLVTAQVSIKVEKWIAEVGDDTEEETVEEMTPFEERLLKDVLRLKEELTLVAKQVNANGCGLDRVEEELEKAIGVLTVIAIPPPIAPVEDEAPKPTKKAPKYKRLNDPQGKLALHFPQASELKVQWNSVNCTAELYSTDKTGEVEEVTVWATMPWRRNKKGFRADYAWQKFAKLLLNGKV